MSLGDILLAVFGLFVTALMFTGQVAPEQAISNIARWWLKPFGIPIPQWLSNPDANQIIRKFAWLCIPVLLIWGLVQWADFPAMRDGPKALLVVGAICVAAACVWHVFRPGEAVSTGKPSEPKPEIT